MDDTSSPRDTYMLTTFDNPFDPFIQWDEWLVWDMNAGYNTPGLLDRVVRGSDELSEVDQFLAVQQAIDEIVRENVSGMHKKVKRGEITNEITKAIHSDVMSIAEVRESLDLPAQASEE